MMRRNLTGIRDTKVLVAIHYSSFTNSFSDVGLRLENKNKKEDKQNNNIYI